MLFRFLLSLSLSLFFAATADAGPQTETLYLSGHGKDDAVAWDFFCTAGRKSGVWTHIAVPSNWELQGFGDYDYGHVKIDKKHREIGKYKRTFTIPAGWRGKRIRIVFEGAMTDTDVRMNGQSAGPIHQGGFYRFDYDITALLKSGENLLEVDVSKGSANLSIEEAERKADYWVFGGIYRPVYLEARPRECLDWSSVDAQADGSFKLAVHLLGVEQATQVTAQISARDGSPAGQPFSVMVKKGDTQVSLSTVVNSPLLWTAETPNLYYVTLKLQNGEQVLHELTQTFGFRTFEVRAGKGLFLNGARIRLKGVDRHCFWPDSARCLSRALSVADVQMIKEMNMNAVRMSHYPPDTHFLEACDELGLYVLDELTGWQKPPYDTPTARRIVKQIVKRDQMHPCILFWDNGNEGGWNTDVDGDFELYDIQKRTVLHPLDTINHMDTAHYRTYDVLCKKLAGDTLHMPTEFLHGLYDGGHGAGLNDYWEKMRHSDLGAGGFLWVFADEGVVRTDKGGIIDTDGNHAPDGIVGPYREKEGSFYTIQEIWSPVQITTAHLPATFDGTLEIENGYSFISLDACTFKWELASFAPFLAEAPTTVICDRGTLRGPAIAPGLSGTLKLPLPADWQSADMLRVSALNPEGRTLFTWTWPLQQPITQIKRAVPHLTPSPLKVEEKDNTIQVTAKSFGATFDHTTGRLLGLVKGEQPLSLSLGPRVVHAFKKGETEAKPVLKVDTDKSDRVVIEVTSPGEGLEQLTWVVHTEGYLEMRCAYRCEGSYDFHGVTFDYPEELVRSKSYLGDGPYRVWKNRMKGTQFGIWSCAYNNTITGALWTYPEFKGYFSKVNWLTLHTQQGRLTVATDQTNLFARLFEPQDGPDPAKTKIPTFKGDLSFLHAIPPIGTKFHEAKQLGPESQQNEAAGLYEINLYFF